MTNEEIVRDYRLAKTPLKQIRILADMNQTSKDEIVKILKEAGCKLPKQYEEKPAEVAERIYNDAELIKLRAENEFLKDLIIKMVALSLEDR